VVFHNLKKVEVSELRDFLKLKLPDYMIPSLFMELDEIPLLPNGKADRKSLPTPQMNGVLRENQLATPSTDTEKTMEKIWAKALNADSIGIHDNFFDLGGHSLLATRIMSRIKTTFQVDLPLRIFFEMPTIAEIAEEIDQRLARRMDSSKTNELLDELEDLSDEEARRFLNEEMD
jgi:acyl carrier protein